MWYVHCQCSGPDVGERTYFNVRRFFGTLVSSSFSLPFPFWFPFSFPFPLSAVVNQKLPSVDEDTVELDAASADSASDCTVMLGALGEGGMALARREPEGSHGTGNTWVSPGGLETSGRFSRISAIGIVALGVVAMGEGVVGVPGMASSFDF